VGVFLGRTAKQVSWPLASTLGGCCIQKIIPSSLNEIHASAHSQKKKKHMQAHWMQISGTHMWQYPKNNAKSASGGSASSNIVCSNPRFSQIREELLYI
jgi:hypothetical protein